MDVVLSEYLNKSHNFTNFIFYDVTLRYSIDSNLSAINKISCGAPQGSVLGPLFFLIYINDFHNSSAKFSFYLFADDTNLLYADKNLKSLEKTLNNELVRVSDWLNAICNNNI